MTNPPERQDDEEQRGANRQADAMRERLRNDVAAEAKKPRTSRPAAKDSTLPKKPFSMSYDGVSSAEYIQYMIDRGSR